MSVTAISGSSVDSYQAVLAAGLKQRAQDFKAVGSALQAGDLVGAQQAFAAFQQDTQTIQSARQSQGQPAAQNTPFSKDFQALESALNKGDLAGAQKAFATLQQDIQTARKSHSSPGHHAHHGGAKNDNDADDGGTASGATTTSTVGTTTNVTA